MRIRVTLIAAGLLLMARWSADGQARRSVLAVAVGESATGAFVSNAEIRLPSLGRVVRTEWNGEATIPDLAAGTYRVEVRAIGFAPSDIDLMVSGDSAGAFFSLERIPLGLDTVRVVSRTLSAAMQNYEARRRMGIGRFLDDSLLRVHKNESLPVLLATRMPGLKLDSGFRGITSTGVSGLLGGGAGAASGGAGRGGVGATGGGGGRCPVLTYLDGFLLAGQDLGSIWPDELAGVELYSRASAPAAYRPQGNYCKVLLLWSRWGG